MWNAALGKMCVDSGLDATHCAPKSLSPQNYNDFNDIILFVYLIIIQLVRFVPHFSYLAAFHLFVV